MCGIIGATEKETVQEIKKHLKHRGKDCEPKKLPEQRYFLGHRLHSIVGHVEQPIETEDGLLSANCEIYNWKQLKQEYEIEAENDAELLAKLLDKKGVSILEELDGIYSFAYYKDNEIILARDILGVNPLWYSEEAPLVFASEKQALEKQNIECRELHPRHILRYNLDTQELTTHKREFSKPEENQEKSEEEFVSEIKKYFLRSVEKRIPEEKDEIALLFSGGLDSTLIAAALKELGYEDFTCYTSGIVYGNVNRPRDVEWAEEIAEEMNLDLKVYNADLEEVENRLEELPDIISSTSAVKNGVALPFDFSLQGDEKVVLSGVGSEQLYAGYNRQKRNINQDCWAGLLAMFERDLYRDNVVCFRNGYELRVPFLDKDLVEHAFTIPEEFKVNEDYRKYILRKVAGELDVPEKVVWRGKVAAQYGSNYDKALSKITGNNGFNNKQKYLNSLRSKPNNRVAGLTSGGKDSNAAIYRITQRNNSLEVLLNLKSQNKDSYMYDTKETSIVEKQAEMWRVPLEIWETEGIKEEEVRDLYEALEHVKEKYRVEGVVAGAIASTYQRDRVLKVAEEAGLKIFTPLWHENRENYLKWLVREGFQIKITEVAARGLTEDIVGKTIDEKVVEKLVQLSEQYGIDIAGEGGEYETVVSEIPNSD